jgi:hypothetical protein
VQFIVEHNENYLVDPLLDCFRDSDKLGRIVSGFELKEWYFTGLLDEGHA